jgi:predicted nucleotidyltransferase
MDLNRRHAVRHGAPVHPQVADRLQTLGEALEPTVPGLLFAYLFGGAASGRITPLSDVDVAIYLADGTDPLDGRLRAFAAVSRHLGTDAVDVVVLNTAPTSLAGRILLGRRVICERDPFQRHRFESVTLRKFFDFRIVERRLLARRYRRG